MPAPWYCLDCGHTGPRPGAATPIVLLLLAPALWTLWSGAAQMRELQELPPVAARAHLEAFGFALFGFFFWLAVPALYVMIANRKRCALCRRTRIIPAGTPVAQAANQARDSAEVERLRAEIHADTRGLASPAPGRH